MKATKRKKLILLISSVLISVIIILLALNYFHVFGNKHKGIGGALIKPEGDSLNIGLYDDTISEQDEAFASKNAPHRVTIVNLDNYAVDSLEDYLDRYFDYYLANGMKYEGSIIKDSYKYNINFPSFKIYVSELDLEINCLYIVARNRYRFDSALSEETE